MLLQIVIINTIIQTAAISCNTVTGISVIIMDTSIIIAINTIANISFIVIMILFITNKSIAILWNTSFHQLGLSLDK